MHIARRVLGLPLVNIGGIDIIDGQHKLLLAILWQLMRFNIRTLLQARALPPHHACRVFERTPYYAVLMLCFEQQTTAAEGHAFLCCHTCMAREAPEY